MTTLLLEPFETLLRWTPTTPANWTIVAGRNGNGVQAASAADLLTHILGAESADATVGVAFQMSSLAIARPVLILRSDAGATTHLTVTVNTDGSVKVTRGTSAGTVLGSASAAGLVVINTWYYLELQATLSDTVGKAEVRLNGVTRIGPLTNQDTKNAGTKTVFDSVVLVGNSGSIQKYDDLYLKVGAGETFNGDTVVTAVTTVINTRQSTRVAVVSTGDARNYRQSVRVAIGGATEARLARISSRLLTRGTPEARLARITARALTSLAVIPGVTVKVWDGAAFVDGSVKVWDGAAFVDALAVKTWTGTDWE